MYAMQYAVQLPADYDMQIIRDRVAANGHRLDGFPGLRFKAYAIRERAEGDPGNEYAPFYVWDDIDGMRAFCWGEPGYSSIVRDFGRHPIQDWTVVRVEDGPADHTAARSLTLTTRALPAGVAPSEAVVSATRDFLGTSDEDTVSRVAAVDVTTWTVVLAETSAAAPDQRRAATTGTSGSATYTVLHLSPGPRG
jgi:hypothetical protein